MITKGKCEHGLVFNYGDGRKVCSYCDATLVLTTGGQYLNTSAFLELVEACKSFMEFMRDTSNRQWASCYAEQLEKATWQALSKAEGESEEKLDPEPHELGFGGD